MAAIPSHPLAPGEAIPARRRGCWSFLFTGTTGCAAFLLGALIAGLALSPKIFAPYLARQMGSALDACLAGGLEVEGVRVGWSKPVVLRGVRLLDESGAELLAGELELPGLLDLLGTPGEPTIVRARVPSLRIALDEHGRSPLLANLAVQTRTGNTTGPLARGGRLEPLFALQCLGYRALSGALRLEVHCEELSWTDARAGEHEARLTDVTIALTTTPRGRALHLDLEARATLADTESEPGLRIDVGIEDYLAPTWEDVEVDVALGDAPAALLDALLGTEGWLTALFGDRMDVVLGVARGSPRQGAQASGSLRSARARCEWKGEWREGRLTVASDSVLGELSATPALLGEQLDELFSLAPGRTQDLALALEQEGLPWSIVEAGLVVSTRFGMPLDEAAEPASWTCKAVLRSPAKLQLLAGGEPLVELGDSRWTLERDARGSKLTVDGSITAPDETQESGLLALVLERDFAKDPESPTAPCLASSVRVSAGSVPAAALDALLGRGSWIAGALGTALDVTFVATDVRAEPVELEIDLRSPSGSSRFRGSCEEGALVSRAEGGLVAELALCPAVEERVLRPLLPWLDRFEAPSSDPGLTLALDAFRLPLDGECAKLQGVAHLSAPSWSYGFLERLGALVMREGEPARFGGLGPYAISIRDGEAAYEGHALASSGGTVDGEVSLVDGGIELELDVPLATAADGAEVAGDATRTTLALDLHGTVDAPRLGMGFEEIGELVRRGGGYLEEMRGRMNSLLQGEKKSEGGDGDGDGQ